MRLLIDIGNSEMTLGLAAGEQILGHWRLTTTLHRTPDEWALLIESLVDRSGEGVDQIRAACVASVAPGATHGVIAAVTARITDRVGVLDARSPVPLVLDVDEPLAVGADRIANALAALARHPGDAIVVDLGTATTFDCVTADRRFIGGSIMPGLRTSADQLVAKAAQLTATELEPPARVIGRTTAEHVQGGILYGTADAIDGMVRRIRAEWPGTSEPRVIATGGLASLIAPLTSTVTVVDPDLTLHGLDLAADALGLPA